MGVVSGRGRSEELKAEILSIFEFGHPEPEILIS